MTPDTVRDTLPLPHRKSVKQIVSLCVIVCWGWRERRGVAEL